MSEQDVTAGVSQQEPAQQTATQGEKMFTQDDVNRIVKERLARAKTVQEPDTRELELEKRENALYLREPILNAVGPTAGGAQSESDAIRKAMGFK